jgi:hypothetical protein
MYDSCRGYSGNAAIHRQPQCGEETAAGSATGNHRAVRDHQRGPVGPLQRQVDRLLLAQYAPPAVVVDDRCRIVEFGAMWAVF